MGCELRIQAETLKAHLGELTIGDKVLLSGYVYTARDAAHKRLIALLDAGEPLPIPLTEAILYYAGPTAAPVGKPIGACGPTTSGRMDVHTPRLLDLGLVAMIGKGERNAAVREAIVRNHSVYFCAIGGAGALAAHCIKSCEVLAFPELGCESVKRLLLQDFPLVVANDSKGGDLFSAGRQAYAV